MKKNKKIELRYRVCLPNGEQVEFVIMAHRTTSRARRLIDADSCKTFAIGSCVHVGTHHELEILQPALWENDHSTQIYYRTVSGRHFVLYAVGLPTLAAVRDVLAVWCVGTAYTMRTGERFDHSLYEDLKTFMRRMELRGYTLIMSK